jgi:predicted nucleotidyltransferase
MTVKRKGAGYNDTLVADERLQSASAIRERILVGDMSALDYLPKNAKIVYSEAVASGKLTRASALDAPVISYLRLNPPTDREYHDCSGGLNYRLRDAGLEANTITSLIALAQTKRYTAARVRRALLSSYFGVTSSDILTYPKFTQVLAMDQIGASILKKTKKMTDFPIITKPSAFTDLGDEVVRQKSLSVRADSVYALCEEKPSSAKRPLTFTPYVKKAR